MSHITGIKSMAKHLSDITVLLTPMQVRTKVISTLPLIFRNLISTLDSVPAADRIMATLTSRLLKKEAMNTKWNSSEKKPNEQALFSKDNRYRNKPKKDDFNRHRGFREKRQEDEKGPNKRKKFFCYYKSGPLQSSSRQLCKGSRSRQQFLNICSFLSQKHVRLVCGLRVYPAPDRPEKTSLSTTNQLNLES